MVVGDVFLGDGMLTLFEDETLIVGTPAGLDAEITNIYIPLGQPINIWIRDIATDLTLVAQTTDESQFGVNLHLNDATYLILHNPGVDGVTVAIDGLVTRRPPTVFT